MMFKHSLGVLPAPINNLFISNNQVHEHNTRQSKNLHSAIGKGEKIYRTFSYHGINIWNYMSTHVNIEVSYACFKKIAIHHLQFNEVNYRMGP